MDGWECKWRPFWDNIETPKFNVTYAKALEKGKTAKMCPLTPLATAMLRDVVSKEEERAAEAQILFDAINQARSDLVLRIMMEYRACPHRAAYDIQQLLKFWPEETKRLKAVKERLKANPEADKLARIYCRLMVWSDPEFTCKNAGEAKKIVVELNKMKKDLEKLKESKVIEVQNGALLMDSQIDELISIIPTKMPEVSK